MNGTSTLPSTLMQAGMHADAAATSHVPLLTLLDSVTVLCLTCMWSMF